MLLPEPPDSRHPLEIDMAGPAPQGAGMHALRSPMLAELMPELDRIEPRARAAVAGLPESKCHESPRDGGGSIAETFAPLCRERAAGEARPPRLPRPAASPRLLEGVGDR